MLFTYLLKPQLVHESYDSLCVFGLLVSNPCDLPRCVSQSLFSYCLKLYHNLMENSHCHSLLSSPLFVSPSLTVYPGFQ